MDTRESALHFWDHEFCRFEDCTPIRAFGARICALKILWNAQKWSKIIKKSIFFKKNILWINVPGSSSNILGMFSAHLWPVKCSKVIWHWWKCVWTVSPTNVTWSANISASHFWDSLWYSFKQMSRALESGAKFWSSKHSEQDKILCVSSHFGTLYRSQMRGKHA